MDLIYSPILSSIVPFCEEDSFVEFILKTSCLHFQVAVPLEVSEEVPTLALSSALNLKKHLNEEVFSQLTSYLPEESHFFIRFCLVISDWTNFLFSSLIGLLRNVILICERIQGIIR